jgi:hypothetical protein
MLQSGTLNFFWASYFLNKMDSDKKIAIVTYDLNLTMPMVSDVMIIKNCLDNEGYNATIVNQWDDTYNNQVNILREFDGIIIRKFYPGWDINKFINADLPIMIISSECCNSLKLGRQKPFSYSSQSIFRVINKGHPVLGECKADALFFNHSLCYNPVELIDDDVDIIMESINNEPVVVIHKNLPLSYFGFSRVHSEEEDCRLLKLLMSVVKWTMSQPVAAIS